MGAGRSGPFVSRSVPSTRTVLAPERDVRTGRPRIGDRSRKDQGTRTDATRARPRWLVPAAGAVVAVSVIAGVAALAGGGAGGDLGGDVDEDPAAVATASVSPRTTQEGSAGTAAVSTDGSIANVTSSVTQPPQPDDLVSGIYDLTLTTTEGVAHLDGMTLTDEIGVVRTYPVGLDCDGSTCVLMPSVITPAGEDDIGDGVLHVESRRPFSGGDCEAQELIQTLDLTIGTNGTVTGTMLHDTEPPVVQCGPNGRRGGARYVYVIEGRRTSAL